MSSPASAPTIDAPRIRSVLGSTRIFRTPAFSSVSMRARDAGERQGRDLVPDALRLRLALREPDARDLRVRVRRVRDEPVLPAAAGPAGEDVEQEPMVVPGGVRELRAPRAVAHRVHAGRARAVVVVHLDEPSPVELHAGGVGAEIVGVGPASGGDEEVGAHHLASAREPDRDAPAPRRRPARRERRGGARCPRRGRRPRSPRRLGRPRGRGGASRARRSSPPSRTGGRPGRTRSRCSRRRSRRGATGALPAP